MSEDTLAMVEKEITSYYKYLERFSKKDGSHIFIELPRQQGKKILDWDSSEKKMIYFDMILFTETENKLYCSYLTLEKKELFKTCLTTNARFRNKRTIDLVVKILDSYWDSSSVRRTTDEDRIAAMEQRMHDIERLLAQRDEVVAQHLAITSKLAEYTIQKQSI